MAEIDITSPSELTLAINNNKAPRRFLTSFFTPLNHLTRDVTIDFVEGTKTLAPFVRDGEKATESKRSGYKTRQVHCYGIELTRTTKALESLKRLPGEPGMVINAMSPTARASRLLSIDLEDLKNKKYRTVEKIISDGFFNGSYDITDADGNVIDSISFGRENALSLSKTWSGAIKTIDTDLDEAATLINQYSGLTATDIIMGKAAAEKALQNDAFLKKLDTKNLSGLQANLTVMAGAKGARLIGSVGGMRLWRYDEVYMGSNGQPASFIPTNKVLVLSDEIQATLHQGIVGDNDIGWFEGEFAVDTWHEKNPPSDILRVRSAPLPVIEQINASCVITVA